MPRLRGFADLLRSSADVSTNGRMLASAADRGEIEANVVESRAEVLASTLMGGVWLTVRIDPHEAGRLCNTIASEGTSWREA